MEKEKQWWEHRKRNSVRNKETHGIIIIKRKEERIRREKRITHTHTTQYKQQDGRLDDHHRKEMVLQHYIRIACYVLNQFKFDQQSWHTTILLTAFQLSGSQKTYLRTKKKNESEIRRFRSKQKKIKNKSFFFCLCNFLEFILIFCFYFFKLTNILINYDDTDHKLSIVQMWFRLSY